MSLPGSAQAAAPEAGVRFAHRNIHLVGAEAFDKKGGWALVCELKKQLESEGRKVYGFPSGGSNDVGTWGYVQAIAEVEQQAEATGLKFDAVYFACGSGVIAAALARRAPALHLHLLRHPSSHQGFAHPSIFSIKVF